MAAIQTAARPACVLGLAFLTLAACSKFGQDEVKWARAALERNSDLEVVAVDQENRVLTVRVKRTGEMSTVRANEVVATLPSASSQSPEGNTESASEKPASAPTQMPTAAPEQTAPPSPAETPAQDVSGSPSYAESGNATQPADTAIAAAPGRTVASGPGYTIKRVGGTSAPVSEPSPAQGTRQSPARVAVEHRSDAIICQGARLLHIDNRNLEFDGNAVSAENGCEVHITNSRIAAKGVGVSARAANVHIKNSFIEGLSGSVEASDGAQVYLQSSTFKGLSRREDSAEMHDLGGNVWN